ncbi:MAG: putative metal-binding motif-containing protein [Deltaproteobacteria bacterium]|nr:putative metal-binding motif-containing protein [Deltaproteobacteria bacterium]
MRVEIHLLMLLVWVGCGGNPPGAEPDGSDDTGGDPWFPCEECDDGNPCTMGRCNPETRFCENIPLDLDGDRYPARSAPDGTWCGGIDCDDADPTTHPGAREVCGDGVDQDCDDVVDGFEVIGEPVRVSYTGNTAFLPDVVWTGSGFAISWTERSGSGGTNVIHLSTLSAEGELIDDTHAVLEAQDISNLLWTGSHLVLAWSDATSRLSLVGMLPDGTEQWTAENLFTSGGAALVWTGSRIGALWEVSGSSTETDILFMLLDDTGVPVGPEVGVDDDRPYFDRHASLAWTGSAFLAAWQGWNDDGYIDVYLRSIGSAGEPLGSSTQLTTRGDTYSPPHIAWSGSTFGISAGNSWSGVHLLRADREGYLTGEPTRVSPPGQQAAGHDLLWAGSLFVVSWSVGQYEGGSPAVVLVDAEGEVVSDVIYASPEGTAQAARWDGGPIHAMAWTGSEVGLAWSDWRDDAETRDCTVEWCDFQIYFARLGWCE